MIGKKVGVVPLSGFVLISFCSFRAHTDMTENGLKTSSHVLLYAVEDGGDELTYLKENFCGIVVSSEGASELFADLAVRGVSERVLFLCGDISQTLPLAKKVGFSALFVIREVSRNFDVLSTPIETISLGQVPINLYGAGVFFRDLFGSEEVDYFHAVENAHIFRQLTESNKPNFALRTGLYMAKVEKVEGHDEMLLEIGPGLKTWLLRCSSNFRDGPTDNFKEVDNQIIAALNSIVARYFKQEIAFNHVLAQIYNNGSRTKAKIKAHSDKTKDMPRHGLIAFCTFYDQHPTVVELGPGKGKIMKSYEDPFDYTYRGTSVLTNLYFKLKGTVEDTTLMKEFTVPLYPNSVFIISLLTNRLYTHEIRPSVLPSEMIPKRMGYVVRCSSTEAIYSDDGRVFIKEEGTSFVEMTQMDKSKLDKLRGFYFDENARDQIVHYDPTDFSMNEGDYVKPTL